LETDAFYFFAEAFIVALPLAFDFANFFTCLATLRAAFLTTSFFYFRAWALALTTFFTAIFLALVTLAVFLAAFLEANFALAWALTTFFLDAAFLVTAFALALA